MPKNIFNTVQMNAPKRNMFDLSHNHTLSTNMGLLVPTLVQNCMPGDSYSLGCEALTRLAPLLSPAFGRVQLTMHYWFVPYRLLWENFEDYITNTKIGSPAALPVHPFINVSESGSNWTPLLDHMGIPLGTDTGTANAEKINALPLAAYQMIFNEWYRDENLLPEINFQLVDGDNSANTHLDVIRNRAWEHDYFTSALPFAQKGDSIDIPLGDVRLDSTLSIPQQVRNAATHALATDQDLRTISPGGLTGIFGQDVAGLETPLVLDPNGTYVVSPTTINDLRQAMRIQEWLERNARGGTRYIENILAHFGVKSSDKRLQRPEYITGTKSNVIISEVLDTAGTSGPVGQMAGHGVSLTEGKYGKYFCEEHGCIIGIVNVQPDTTYTQSLDRLWLTIGDPTEYPWPEFANLGEQAVYNSEIFPYQATGDQRLTWGYLPRYSEHKYKNSRVSGDFRLTLDYWTWARKFAPASNPALNATFVTADPTLLPFATIAIGTDHLYLQIRHYIKALRPLPKYGVPTL